MPWRRAFFFVGVELFTVFYSGIPEDVRVYRYLFAGLGKYHRLVGWMWASAILALGALILLIYWNVKARRKVNEGLLVLACIAVFVSLWIEKGLGLVIPGFIPSPLERITEYAPTGPEVAITFGVWALGFLILTLLYRIFVAIRLEE